MIDTATQQPVTWLWLRDQYAALNRRRAELDQLQEILKREEFAERHSTSQSRYAAALTIRGGRSAQREPANGRTYAECVRVVGR